ncbi:MAG: VOC family protein [Omnitrophica WOR_2 bacterium]|jgi:predicted enzyme related to lactoylglutathione lyase
MDNQDSQGRVTGFGGIFIKYNDPERIKQWYAEFLGFNVDEYGTSFEWRKSSNPEQKAYTLWAPFSQASEYFKPSDKEIMLNFRVDNLDAILSKLAQKGIYQLNSIEETDYGRFAHIVDPEGFKLELWEADDIAYDKMVGEKKTF